MEHHRRSTVCAVRMVEGVELVACHVFNIADRDGQRVSMELVRTRLAKLREHPPGCCRLYVARPRWRPADVYRTAEIVDGFAIARFRWAIAISAYPLTPGR